MRMSRDGGAEGPTITGFAAGGFRVDEGVYHALLITPQRATAWSPPPLDRLAASDLAPLTADDPPPEFVLLGTGPALVRPSATLLDELEALGFGIEPMDSRAAARAWGMLRGEGRRIAAALYPLD